MFIDDNMKGSINSGLDVLWCGEGEQLAREWDPIGRWIQPRACIDERIFCTQQGGIEWWQPILS